MLAFDSKIDEFWRTEKMAAVESIKVAKEQALNYIAKEQEKIMRMTHDQAINELLKANKFESKIDVIKGVSSNDIIAELKSLKSRYIKDYWDLITK
jgi:type II restriction enzyme